MKQLEKRIMEKVYQEETKNLGISFLARVVIFLFGIFIVVLFSQVIGEFLYEGQILSLSEILQDDWTVIAQSCGSVFSVIFDEIPPPLFVMLAGGLLLCIMIISGVIRNRNKLRNKVRAIVRFKQHKENS